eukprot:552384-Hanusia_phi.AAC.1
MREKEEKVVNKEKNDFHQDCCRRSDRCKQRCHWKHLRRAASRQVPESQEHRREEGGGRRE